jgi:tetratricopeptide (TPR) repeat protein
MYERHVGLPGSTAAVAAERAYTYAMGGLSAYYVEELEKGNTGILTAMRIEEGNLLRAVELGRRHRMTRSEVNALQALHRLYRFTGRDTAWASLVTQALSDYLEPNGGPRPGFENEYGIVTSWRIEIARGRRDFATAVRLQTAMVTRAEDRARPYLDQPAADLDPRARSLLRSLAVAEQDLGHLLIEQDDPSAALVHYQASYDLVERIADTAGPAIIASCLGNAYLQLRNLDLAEVWFQRSLDLAPSHNRVGRAASHGSLARVAYNRFEEARKAGVRDARVLSGHLSAAIAAFQRTLDLLPHDHHEYRAVAHNELGNVYALVGDVAKALRHYQQSIQHKEIRGDPYGAALTRENAALLLEGAHRHRDALDYAVAAHANFLALGAGAAARATKAAALVRRLQQRLRDAQDQS